MAQKNEKPDKQAKSKKKNIFDSVRASLTYYFCLSVVITKIAYENFKTGTTFRKPEVPF